LQSLRSGILVVGTGAAGACGLALSACATSGSPPAAQAGRTATTSAVASTTSTTSASAITATTSASATTSTTRGSSGTGGGSGSPVLGASGAFGPSGVGFGQVRPAAIALGGDPTGIVTGIAWQSWGGAQATGTGRGTYVGPGQTVAQGTMETATVVAYDLGTCKGAPAYLLVTWYFAAQGQTLQSGAIPASNACAGP
jgi:hypothetical protein